MKEQADGPKRLFLVKFFLSLYATDGRNTTEGRHSPWNVSLHACALRLLSSQSGEIQGDVVPGLKSVRAEVDEGGHAFGAGCINEIIAIKEVFLIGKNRVAIGRDIDVFVEPGECIGVGLGISVGGDHKEQLIGFKEDAEGFL